MEPQPLTPSQLVARGYAELDEAVLMEVSRYDAKRATVIAHLWRAPAGVTLRPYCAGGRDGATDEAARVPRDGGVGGV